MDGNLSFWWPAQPEPLHGECVTLERDTFTRKGLTEEL